jgi:O-antigen/teichoic acid export membrane protein
VIPYLRQIRAVARWKPFETSTPEGRSDERYRRIVLTTASSMAVRAVGLVAGLVTVPLLLGYLGKEQFGLWTAITSIVTWATLFDLGLSSGLVNLVARAHGREDQAGAREAFATALVALVAVAAGLAILAGVFLPLVPWSSLLGARGILPDEAVRWSVAAALAAFLIGLPLGAVPQVYAGYQKTYVVNAFNLLGTILGLAVLVAAVLGRASMPALVLCLSAGGLLASSLALVYARKALPWVQVRIAHVSRNALLELTSRSIPIFLFQLGALAVNETQVIILARRSGLSTVTDYAVAFRLYAVTSSLIQLGTASFVPPLREAYERGDRAWALRAFRNLQVIRLAMAGVGGLGLVVLGNLVLRLWLGRTDMSFGPGVWISFAVLLLASVWGAAYSEFLWIMDRIWPLVVMVLMNGLITIGMTWWLAPEYGVKGAVVATTVFTVAIASWSLPLMARPLLRSRSEQG